MKLRLVTITLLLALVSMVAIAPMGAFAAQSAASPLTGIPIANAPVSDATGTVGSFTGTLNITRFVTQNGGLAALGTLDGTVTYLDPSRAPTAITNQAVTLPISISQATCQILALDLGPLHLDLLGLVVDLSAIHLTITAVPGAGNLLGNLLCAVANLLNGGGPLSNLIALLNQILSILG
jgi:hypothetical protein